MPDANAISNFNSRSQSIRDLQNNLHKKPNNVKIVKKNEQILGKDSFLKLLITQLSHQNPLEPVDDKAFISQMAQFSTLEQMNNVAKNLAELKNFQANLLIGKQVIGKDFISGDVLEGKATQIIKDASGNVFVTINGRRSKLNDIVSVSEAIIAKQIPVVPVSRETISIDKPTEIKTPQQVIHNAYK